MLSQPLGMDARRSYHGWSALACLLLIVTSTAAVAWYGDTRTPGDIVTALVQTMPAGERAGFGIEQARSLARRGGLDREIWSGVVAAVEAVVIAFVLQGMLLLRRREVPISRIITVVAAAGVLIVARDAVHASMIARAPAPSPRLILTHPASLAWLMPAGVRPIAPAYQAANALNLFELLWCATIVLGLSGLRLRRSTRLVSAASIWVATVAVRVAGYWILSRVL